MSPADTQGMTHDNPEDQAIIDMLARSAGRRKEDQGSCVADRIHLAHQIIDAYQQGLADTESRPIGDDEWEVRTAYVRGFGQG